MATPAAITTHLHSRGLRGVTAETHKPAKDQQSLGKASSVFDRYNPFAGRGEGQH